MLSVIDPDSGAFANHTFTLVAGAGDADNGRFTVSDNKLQIKQNEVINFEAQQRLRGARERVRRREQRAADADGQCDRRERSRRDCRR